MRNGVVSGVYLHVGAVFILGSRDIEHEILLECALDAEGTVSQFVERPFLRSNRYARVELTSPAPLYAANAALREYDIELTISSSRGMSLNCF